MSTTPFLFVSRVSNNSLRARASPSSKVRRLPTRPSLASPNTASTSNSLCISAVVARAPTISRVTWLCKLDVPGRTPAISMITSRSRSPVVGRSIRSCSLLASAFISDFTSRLISAVVARVPQSSLVTSCRRFDVTGLRPAISMITSCSNWAVLGRAIASTTAPASSCSSSLTNSAVVARTPLNSATA